MHFPSPFSQALPLRLPHGAGVGAGVAGTGVGAGTGLGVVAGTGTGVAGTGTGVAGVAGAEHFLVLEFHVQGDLHCPEFVPVQGSCALTSEMLVTTRTTTSNQAWLDAKVCMLKGESYCCGVQ